MTWFWRYDKRKGRWTKQPKTIVRDEETCKFSFSKPNCLRPLSEVLEHLETRPKSGIGFSFHFIQPSPSVGIDLDSCRNAQTGELTDFAREIVELIGSYTEISVNRKGLHILARGEIPRSRREKPIEMYANTGYFAFTGRRLEGTPASLEERQAEISELYDREFPERKPLTKTPRERAKLRSEGKRESDEKLGSIIVGSVWE